MKEQSLPCAVARGNKTSKDKMQSKNKVQEKQKGAIPPAEENDDGWSAVLSPVWAVGGFFSSLVSPARPQEELAPEEQEEDERYARFLKKCVTKENPESKEHRHRDRKNGKHREKKAANHDRDGSKRRSRDDGERRKKRDDRQTDSSGQPKQSSNDTKKNAPNSPPSQVPGASKIVPPLPQQGGQSGSTVSPTPTPPSREDHTNHKRGGEGEGEREHRHRDRKSDDRDDTKKHRETSTGAVGNHTKESAENKSKQVQESARNADSSIGKTNTDVSGRLDSRDDPLSIIRNNYSIDDGNANQGGPGYSSSNYSGPSLQNPRYSSSNYSVPPPQHPGYSSINYGVPPHQYPNQGGPGYPWSNYFIPPPPPQHPGYSSINYGLPPHQYPNQGGPGYPWSNYFVPPPPPQQGTLPPPLPQQGGQSGSTVSPTPTPPSREDHTNHKRGGEGEGEREHRHRDRKSDDRDDTKKHRETSTGVVGRLNGGVSQDDDGGISRYSDRKHSHRDRRHDNREDRNKRGGRHNARKHSHSRKDKHHDNDDWYSDRKHSHRDKRDDDRERNRRGGRYHAREQSHRGKDKHYDNDDRSSSSSSNSSCSSGTSNSDDASLNDSVSTTSSVGSSTTSEGSISVSSETSSEADSEYMASLIAEGASTTLSVATRAVQSIGNLKTRMEVDALKKKADKYFLVGKLQEAKDIYNRAEKLDPFHIQVLMNRAACHLAMRDSAACLQDCNNALNLLSKGKPKSDSSTCALPDGCTKRKWQVFLLCRRAAAKELAHDFRGALCDLEDAKKIARNDNDLEGTKEIARNIDDLKAKMNSINTKVKTKGNQSLSAMLGLSFM